jgi:hypothetical protein
METVSFYETLEEATTPHTVEIQKTITWSVLFLKPIT